MAKIVIGSKAPSFNLPATGGEIFSLKSLKGKKVVLYFYPKDDTPGCTKEACGFSDKRSEFLSANAEIVGVSKDSLAKHEKFKTKYDLHFELASDEESETCEAYGVWKEKNMYGRKYMGIERSTFLIDEKGIVRAEWRKVKVPGHVEAVLDATKKL
ncbi:MAG: thioredoxin-dependent thiol peroxidase [Rhodospirillaceae bacterium]|nr:thioredoxin-dependent thiol peroxidase [Rhodospirillaceae bacterium]